MTDLADFLAKHDRIIEISLQRVKGSSPREAGAKLYISQTSQTGTIGGGQLEYMAIDKARIMLAGSSQKASQTMSVPLGPEIGQCCGGHVTLHLHTMSNQDKHKRIQQETRDHAKRPVIHLFGAGHIGRALASTMALLPIRPILIDSRETELALCGASIEKQLIPLPEAIVRSAPKGSAYIIATHDHALDFLLAHECLARRDASYIGMIGSHTKAARFAHWLAGEAPDLDAANLVCPMADWQILRQKDKRPEVIAALITAEVMLALQTGMETEISLPDLAQSS